LSHASDEPRVEPDMPSSMDGLVQRLLSKQMNHRFVFKAVFFSFQLMASSEPCYLVVLQRV
jgi:hypothetical protein